jgi:hypothetical protein
MEKTFNILKNSIFFIFQVFYDKSQCKNIVLYLKSEQNLIF